MSVIDLSTLSDDQRRQLALQVQSADDFELPHLSYWNYEPCENHESIEEGSNAIPPCQNCGIIPRKHQRIGAAWAYLEKKVLLADQCGTGKSFTCALTLALMKESGELNDFSRKVLFVVPPSAIIPWQRVLRRVLPDVKVLIPPRVKSKRIAAIIHSDWQFCITGFQSFNNDMETYRSKNIYMLITDDIDALANNTTKTHYAVNQIAPRAERVFELNATPLSQRLLQLYNTLLAVDGRSFLGTSTTFERRYVKYHFGHKSIVTRGGGTKQVMQRDILGYKNLDELKEIIQPKVLRRTATDLDDVEMPALVPNNVFLELYPIQRQKYEALKKGVVQIQKESGGTVTLTKANNVFLQGQRLCDGMAFQAEADLPGTSCKLDWLENKLVDGDLSDEKVVVFMRFKDGIRAMQKRLSDHGIGYETYWGEESDKNVRMASQDRFWDDPDCRVFLGTEALERSINLQIARHLVAVDLIMNPGRMTQLSHRVKRDGSSYRTVYLHQLLTVDTQEDRYLQILQKRQAVSDVIFGDTSEIFTSGLSSAEMLALITG